MPEASASIQLLVRWFHIFFGIVWIGHLYFFNFVNVPFQGVLAKELKPQVNPPLLLRALYWFRWGAMFTFLFGLTLFALMYWPMGGYLFDQDGLSRRGMWMLLGGLLGTIMWFNVWFVIWPAQKQIIGAMLGGPAAPPELPKRALLFSRINTFLSAPMLAGMIAGSHQDVWSVMPAWMHGVFILLGLGAVHGLIKSSYKVGQGL
ncbi:MAG TPA: urate hydroxylase PuuD [Vicinamibacteria bacterium]|nr:urate hydroxylase PuuD [Vicinamibacteria bacterium]